MTLTGGHTTNTAIIVAESKSKGKYLEVFQENLAAPQGFEPRYADPESAVLPLNEGAV